MARPGVTYTEVENAAAGHGERDEGADLRIPREFCKCQLHRNPLLSRIGATPHDL